MRRSRTGRVEVAGCAKACRTGFERCEAERVNEIVGRLAIAAAGANDLLMFLRVSGTNTKTLVRVNMGSSACLDDCTSDWAQVRNILSQQGQATVMQRRVADAVWLWSCLATIPRSKLGARAPGRLAQTDMASLWARRSKR